MSTPRRLAAVAGLALAALFGAAACSVTTANILADGFTSASAVTAVRLEHSGSGDVSVIADAGVTGVDVRRTVHYVQTKPAQTARVDASTLILDMNCGNGCSVSYQVRLPVGAAVSGSATSGDVTLHGVGSVDLQVSSGDVTVDGASSVDIRSTSGNVILNDIAGPASVHVTSGDIRAHGLSGPTVQLDTTSGDITATLVKPANVTARVDSGDVELRVPTASYRIEAHSNSGDRDVSVPNDPSGTYTLDVSSSSGDITIAAA